MKIDFALHLHYNLGYTVRHITFQVAIICHGVTGGPGHPKYPPGYKPKPETRSLLMKTAMSPKDIAHKKHTLHEKVMMKDTNVNFCYSHRCG